MLMNLSNANAFEEFATSDKFEDNVNMFLSLKHILKDKKTTVSRGKVEKGGKRGTTSSEGKRTI